MSPSCHTRPVRAPFCRTHLRERGDNHLYLFRQETGWGATGKGFFFGSAPMWRDPCLTQLSDRVTCLNSYPPSPFADRLRFCEQIVRTTDRDPYMDREPTRGGSPAAHSPPPSWPHLFSPPLVFNTFHLPPSTFHLLSLPPSMHEFHTRTGKSLRGTHTGSRNGFK